MKFFFHFFQQTFDTMDVQQYFTQKKKLYNILHEFIESDVSDENSVLKIKKN